MDWRAPLVVLSLALAAAPAAAQLALPGAESSLAGRPTSAAKPKKAKHAATGGVAKGRSVAAPDLTSVAGRPLMLNGSSGLLQVSGSNKTLRIDKLKLVGEGVSDSAQKCEVDIIGETPIEATHVGRPEGLERYEVDVPACPFAFEILDGAVVVPAQITACMFKAADCQTSPGGVWGPDSANMDAAEVAKRRTAAEKAMGKALHALEERAQDNPDAANLLKEQNSFPGQRDDQCRSYVKEAALGYCGAVVTEGRAAFLESRLAELPPATARVDSKAKKRTGKVKKKPKPKLETAPTASQPADATAAPKP